MAEKLKDDKLKSILESAISNSEHITDGKLGNERRQVERYYRGELPEPLHAGDSKYVSRDVFDAVDSMRATVLEGFMAHSRIVFFRPEKGETVDDAKQATEYCRHVFFKKNNGENILYDALTDGLMKRLAVAKVYFEEDNSTDEYDFDALTPDELTAMVMEYDEFEFTNAEIDQETGLLSGTFEVQVNGGKIVVEVIQPEDFLVSSRTSELRDAKYAIHRTSKTKSQLLKEGYDEKKVNKINFSGMSDFDLDLEKQMRFEMVDDVISTDDGYQEAVQEITVYEVYIRLDMEETGKESLYKVVYAGGEILEKERISRMPFASFVPLPVTHTFFGDNFAHSVIPVQNARTILIRQIINHSMITNNPRLQVLNGTVQNPQELLDNRLGGLVNVRRMDGLAPIPQHQLNPYVFNLIQMIDEDKEEVTGISKLSQGLNKDAISTQNAEGMVEQLISASQQRQKIIARRFGMFLKELYLLIYHTAIDYIEEDEFIDVTGTFVPVNPKDWQARSAASVELTLSYAEQQRESTKWMEIDAYIKADPILSKGYDYAKSYEVATRALENRGIEDISVFLTPPDELPEPEPDPMALLQMEMQKSQIELQKAQAQATVMKAETDRMKAEADLLKAKTDAAAKGAKATMEERHFDHEKFMDIEELEMARSIPDKRANISPNE